MSGLGKSTGGADARPCRISLRPQSVAAKKAYQGMQEARERWVANTTSIPFKHGENWWCRYAYGYGLDGSDLPCFILWPERVITLVFHIPPKGSATKNGGTVLYKENLGVCFPLHKPYIQLI